MADAHPRGATVMKPPLVQACVELFRPPQRKPTIILLSSSLLLCLWRVFGSRGFYAKHLASRFVLAGDSIASEAWYEIGMCCLLLCVVPMAIVKFVLGDSLKEYGWQRGDVKLGIVFFVLSAPIILLVSYCAAADEVFRAEYPLNRHAGVSRQTFAVHAASLWFFYIGWEFHFRGFLLQGLTPSAGSGNSVWIQTMAATLAHIGKPPAELFACIPASVVWGLLAIQTQSLWVGLLQHWLLGVSLDYFISFGA